MVKGIESNVVDGRVSWRAVPGDSLGTEENGSFWSREACGALVQSRSDKTMPVYGAKSRAPNHADIRENKTAGRQAVILRKTRAWMGALSLAP